MPHNKHETKKASSCLVLHNIRSAHNVGAIFRTADAAGVEKIYLSGFTPAPVDRFGRERDDIKKSALGAEKTVLWEQKKRIIPLIKKLKRDGFCIIGVEQVKNARDYKTIKINFPAAFVFGNEVAGLSQNALGACDIVAEIPMRGKKESLNVAVAAGIVLFRVLDI